MLLLVKSFKPADRKLSIYLSEGLVLELWGIWSTLLWPLLLGQLGEVESVVVQPVGQIELFNHLLFLKPVNCAQIEPFVLDNNT